LTIKCRIVYIILYFFSITTILDNISLVQSQNIVFPILAVLMR